MGLFDFLKSSKQAGNPQNYNHWGNNHYFFRDLWQRLINPTTSKIDITSETGYQIAAYWAAVRAISEDIAKLKVGQTLQIDNLFFQADSSAITDESYEVLNEVHDFMSTNTNVVIEIGGHTNNIPPDDYCDRLSTSRAKTVAEFLYNRGLSENRISYRGYGKRKPIATNETPAGRKKNQRVEIKILRLSD